MGNLRTAWLSHRLAHALGLEWWVRFEDIDGPRVKREGPGSQDDQLADLQRLGLQPQRVLLQSEAHDRHEALFKAAREQGRVYPCTCSRRDLRAAIDASASAPHAEAPVYSGACRARAGSQVIPSTDLPTLAWRWKNEDPSGAQDFVVGRTAPQGAGDFQPSYTWACALDDFEEGYAVLVRAWDLAPQAEAQQVVQRWLQKSKDQPLPVVFHASLVLADASGQRLEKRTQGVTLSELAFSTEELLRRWARGVDFADLARQIRAAQPGALLGERAREVALPELLRES